MSRIVIAGGPHTGKTTLYTGLTEIYKGTKSVHFIPEPAGLIIAGELEKQRQDADYIPCLPTTTYPEFARLVTQKSIVLERATPKGALAIQDRSHVDNIAYARLNGRHDLVPDMRDAAQKAGYTAIIMCAPVGHYEVTQIRREDQAWAQAIHTSLLAAYGEMNLPTLDLPALPVDERLVTAQAFIGSFLTPHTI